MKASSQPHSYHLIRAKRLMFIKIIIIPQRIVALKLRDLLLMQR